MDRPIPEPFYLDLPTPLTLDLPPPKKPHITSDFPHKIPHEKYDPKEILKLIEDSFSTPERKVRKTPRQVIVENTLVPNSPKWNRYYKYQEAIKHGRKLTREQIVDWTKMWVEVHPKEVKVNKFKNYEKKLKVQETNRKLDCMIDGLLVFVISIPLWGIGDQCIFNDDLPWCLAYFSLWCGKRIFN